MKGELATQVALAEMQSFEAEGLHQAIIIRKRAELYAWKEKQTQLSDKDIEAYKKSHSDLATLEKCFSDMLNLVALQNKLIDHQQAKFKRWGTPTLLNQTPIVYKEEPI